MKKKKFNRPTSQFYNNNAYIYEIESNFQQLSKLKKM